jgi:hypothetical protein
MTTPNNDPAVNAPEFQITEQTLGYLSTFTTDLIRLGRDHLDYGDDVEGNVEHNLHIGIRQSLANGDPTKLPLELAVTAISLGATKDKALAKAITNRFEDNPLLSPDDREQLVQLSKSASTLRDHHVSEEEITTTTAEHATTILQRVRELEAETGQEKGPLKVALLAFFTGATLMYPGYDAADQLFQEAQSHVLAETH